MNLLIFIALLCGLFAGVELHSLWLAVPCGVAILGWVIVGGA